MLGVMVEGVMLAWRVRSGGRHPVEIRVGGSGWGHAAGCHLCSSDCAPY